MKHPSTNILEKLRESDLDNSLQLSPVSEQRAVNLPTCVEEVSAKKAFKCQ